MAQPSGQVLFRQAVFYQEGMLNINKRASLVKPITKGTQGAIVAIILASVGLI